MQINTVVSGALDRLHYEKDPCVKYDGARKVWIYRHRCRTEEEFGICHFVFVHNELVWVGQSLWTRLILAKFWCFLIMTDYVIFVIQTFLFSHLKYSVAHKFTCDSNLKTLEMIHTLVCFLEKIHQAQGAAAKAKRMALPKKAKVVKPISVVLVILF